MVARFHPVEGRKKSDICGSMYRLNFECPQRTGCHFVYRKRRDIILHVNSAPVTTLFVISAEVCYSYLKARERMCRGTILTPLYLLSQFESHQVYTRTLLASARAAHSCRSIQILGAFLCVILRSPQVQ